MELPRFGLDHELTKIREDILRMGSMIERCVTWSVPDASAHAKGAITEATRRASHLRQRIERTGLTTLATQHPAARDLRRVIAAMHIAHELERSAEHCRDIGKMYGSGSKSCSMPVLLQMRDHLATMLHDSMDAYVRGNVQMAIEVVRHDTVLDEARAEVVREVSSSRDAHMPVEPLLRMYWTAHHLERIGDRAVNICERVMFEATGHLIDVSQPVVQRWVGHSTP